MEVTVVICAKDESATLPDVVLRARRIASRIIIVSPEDPGLSDVHWVFDPGKGKGLAIRLGLAKVKTPIVAFCDADGSHDPRDIPKLVTLIRQGVTDHVGGSRLTGGSDELHGSFDEFLRLTGSSFITWMINARFGSKISDSQNGFRALRTEVALQLGLKSLSTTIEQEMIMKTLKKGFRYSEVPTHEYRRTAGISKIRLSRVWFAYLRSLFTGILPNVGISNKKSEPHQVGSPEGVVMAVNDGFTVEIEAGVENSRYAEKSSTLSQ